ncbi:ABC transporter [Enterococcus phage EFKL]|nr:ABC transporter [Enterococcus phage EFKL]
MKLIDGEALLATMTNKLEAPEDDYDEGWNDAVETCLDEITDALVKAKEEASETPIAFGGNPFTTGYLTPSEMSLKAPESNFKVVTEDNTLTALKLVRDAIEDNYSDEEALIYVNGMIAALEM